MTVLDVCLSSFEANIDFRDDDKNNHSVGNSISGMGGEHVLLCLAHDLFEFVGIFIVFNTRVKLKECVYVCPRSSQSSCTPGEILMLSTHLTGHTMTNLFMNKYFKTLFNCGTMPYAFLYTYCFLKQ